MQSRSGQVGLHMQVGQPVVASTTYPFGHMFPQAIVGQMGGLHAHSSQPLASRMTPFGHRIGHGAGHIV
jgi:hypothetical protein